MVDEKGIINKLNATGTISGNARNAGTICANLFGGSQINDCTSSANISGSFIVGGIAGWTVNSYISNCTNTGSITSVVNDGDYWTSTDDDGVEKENAASSVGGIVGSIAGGSVKNCNNRGAITATNSSKPDNRMSSMGIGGIVGWVRQNVIINSCNNFGNINSVKYGDKYGNYVGGVVGSTNYGQIYNSQSAGSLTGSAGSLTGSATYLYISGITNVTSDEENEIKGTLYSKSNFYKTSTAEYGLYIFKDCTVYGGTPDNYGTWVYTATENGPKEYGTQAKDTIP